ncbi:SufD family Fe-S cluster assembly protein [Salmonella enterica subsp. enterica]|nr:SufD family Fe-S cluster assembly protein [Salmonella enterica subsp. enterica]
MKATRDDRARADDEQMFHLQSRGIRQQEARHMILTRLPQS